MPDPLIVQRTATPGRGGKGLLVVGIILAAVVVGGWLSRAYLDRPPSPAELARVRAELATAQAERAQCSVELAKAQGAAPAFLVRGQVSECADGAVTLWGWATPVQEISNLDLDGLVLQASTLVLRHVDPQSVSVGTSCKATGYFIERQAVPGRVGQPPVWTFVYDMQEPATITQLRQRTQDLEQRVADLRWRAEDLARRVSR